jgi:uncharacterized membrane protein YkoI
MKAGAGSGPHDIYLVTRTTMQIKTLLVAVAVATTAAAQAPLPQSAAPTKTSAAAGYKRDVPAKLAAKAKVTEAAAAAIALASVPGGKIEGVELEEEDGAFIYSYDIKVAGKNGVNEVHVDAMTGKILKSAHEDPTSAKEAAALPAQQGSAAWRTTFNLNKSTLASTGRNRFFVLEPGHQQVFDGGGEHLVITVLARTELVDAVTTRVVEERETKDGALIEVSRNFFAFGTGDSSVYYFGEDVDMYKDGKIVNHEGSWRSGMNGAHFGLMLPASPVKGMRYHQEVAPKVAMDRAEIVSINDAVKVPAGSYTACIRTEETTPLEPGVKEYKRYCPGVGLVEDGDLRLVRAGPAKVP